MGGVHWGGRCAIPGGCCGHGGGGNPSRRIAGQHIRRAGRAGRPHGVELAHPLPAMNTLLMVVAWKGRCWYDPGLRGRGQAATGGGGMEGVGVRQRVVGNGGGQAASAQAATAPHPQHNRILAQQQHKCVTHQPQHNDRAWTATRSVRRRPWAHTFKHLHIIIKRHSWPAHHRPKVRDGLREAQHNAVDDLRVCSAVQGREGGGEGGSGRVGAGRVGSV